MSRYEEYQETGFDWLGKIPSNWGLSRVGKFFTERSEKVDDVTYPPLSVTMSGIVDQLSDVAKTNDGGNRKLVKKHDFVINSRSDRKGSSGISPRDGSVSLINIVLEPRELDPQFIQYLFKNYYFKEEYFRNGKGIHWDLWTTRWDQLKNIKFPIPSNKEQLLISRYLDKKTEQIDSLIEKIQKKIELLKEQRTSLINQCVTKGLDPNVEMKDSGVEWIGEIPSHWEVKKLKYVVQIQKDIVGELGFDVLSVTQKGLKIKDLSRNDGQMSMDYSKYQKVNINQFVMNHMDLLTGYVDKSKYNGVTSPDYRVFNLTNPLILPEYLLSILQFGYLGKIFYRYGKGVSSMGRWRLPSDEFLNISIPLPPPTEQETIIQTLDNRIINNYDLCQKETHRIDLLKEYRQSLISYLVTGKVRVTEDMI